MKSLFLILCIGFLYLLHANTSTRADMQKIAAKFNLYAGAKASVQWERIFASPRHLKKYKLDTLDEEIRQKLKHYLITHAADSDQPIVPGL